MPIHVSEFSVHLPNQDMLTQLSWIDWLRDDKAKDEPSKIIFYVDNQSVYEGVPRPETA